MTIRAQVWRTLEGERGRLSRIVNASMFALILLNVLAVIFETVAWVAQHFARELRVFEVFSVAVFSVEYLLRVWSCREAAPYQGRFGRVRFFFTPLALIDLVAVLPAYLPLAGVDLRQLRVIRLFRLLRAMKLVRYSRSLRIIGKVLVRRRGELLSTLGLMLALLIGASSVLYFAERGEQPEVFGSIPASMWWGVATLTTVGYGDVYPITALGRVLGGLVAIFGVGLFALPAGILGAAFADELRRAEASKVTRCPHCGHEWSGS